MTDDLERRLRDTFAVPAASGERVVRSALASEGRRGRPPAALFGLLVLIVGLVVVLAPRLRPSEPEPPILTISNLDRVITVVEPSGHVWLLSAGTPSQLSGGGVILNLGENQ